MHFFFVLIIQFSGKRDPGNLEYDVLHLLCNHKIQMQSWLISKCNFLNSILYQFWNIPHGILIQQCLYSETKLIIGWIKHLFSSYFYFFQDVTKCFQPHEMYVLVRLRQGQFE